jgi:hypothetical protein
LLRLLRCAVLLQMLAMLLPCIVGALLLLGV